MSLAILYVVTAALWIAVANKVVQIRRAPDDPPLRAVAACFACLSVAFTLSLPPVTSALDHAAAGLPILLVNLDTMMACYWLLAFFMYSVHGSAAQRSMRRQVVPAAAAFVIATAAWGLSPAAVRVAPTVPANGTDGHAAVFVLAVVGYLGYAQVMQLRWSVSYARIARRAHLRRGLIVVCVSLVTLLGACVTKATLAVTLWLKVIAFGSAHALDSAYVLLVAIGTLAFVAGFSYPAAAGMVAAVPLWRDHRRHYRGLRPLWVALHRAFPDLALVRRPASRWHELFGLRHTHRRFYRRVIEIRDGLVLLAPYYDAEVAERAEADARRSGQSGIELAATVEARLIACALRLKATEAPAPVPYAVPVVGGQDLASDARWLVAVARSMAAQTADPGSGMPGQPTPSRGVPGR